MIGQRIDVRDRSVADHDIGEATLSCASTAAGANASVAINVAASAALAHRKDAQRLGLLS
jgi:predicted RNA methylase